MNTRISAFCTSIIIAISSIASQNLFSQSGKAIQIESWITNPDRSALFEKQSDTLFFSDSKQGMGNHNYRR